jgi:tetratricopeptide (TPR) repeat protein
MMKKIVHVIIASLLLVSFLEAKSKSDIDYVSLSALLIKDAHYDRALKNLALVDLKDESIDLKRYYTLKALALMNLKDYEEAIDNFKAALKAGHKDPIIHVYMAQSYFKLEAYKHVLDAFEKIGNVRKSKAGYIAMYVESLWKLDRKDEAVTELESGIKLFPKFENFHKQGFYYFTQMKLFLVASKYARSFVTVSKKPAKAYLLVGSLLSKAKADKLAMQMLQEGKLKFPMHSDITVMVAHLYIKKGKIQAAADLFDQASIMDSKYIKEASEIYRRAKKLYRSLYFNTRIKDQKEKYKQRMAILLEFADFEMIAAMEQALKRVDLIKDEDIRYALAFTLFKTGQYDKSELHLSQLQKAENFKKSIELRKMIENCKQSPWECQ